MAAPCSGVLTPVPEASVAADLRLRRLEGGGVPVLLETGPDPAGHERVGGDAVRGPAAVGLHGEQHVGGLRLAVGDARVVGPPVEEQVVEGRRVRCRGRSSSPPPPGRRPRPASASWRPSGQREVAEVVGGELELPALRGVRLGAGHDPGVVDQDVQRPVPRGDQGAHGPDGRPGRARARRHRVVARARATMSSRRRAAGAGVAHGQGDLSARPASARAVSSPMPAAPPVTRARRPERSRPATTSAAVLVASNGVVMRVMGAPGEWAGEMHERRPGGPGRRSHARCIAASGSEEGLSSAAPPRLLRPSWSPRRSRRSRRSWRAARRPCRRRARPWCRRHRPAWWPR